MEVVIPHDKFLDGKILPRNALLPFNTKKSPWKRLYTSQ